MYQRQGAAQALGHTLERLHDDTGFARVWRELVRADRAVLLLAARGVQDLYSAPGRWSNCGNCWVIRGSRQAHHALRSAG